MISEIAELATAAAVLVAAAGLFGQIRARKFGIAQVYIQRYWEVDEYFLQSGRMSVDSVSVRRYLRLCEGEFDAARQGWVDVSVWRAWHEGIRSQVAELQVDVTTYRQLKQCTEQSDHKATSCPGFDKIRWRRTLAWWFESLTAS